MKLIPLHLHFHFSDGATSGLFPWRRSLTTAWLVWKLYREYPTGLQACCFTRNNGVYRWFKVW